MKKLLLLYILSFPLVSVAEEDTPKVDLSISCSDCECDCQIGIVQRVKNFFKEDEEIESKIISVSPSTCEDLAKEFNELQAACELDKLADKPNEQESCNRLIQEKLAALEQCKK